MKRKLIWLCCLLLVLGACGGEKEKKETTAIMGPVAEGDYRIIKSLASSNTRLAHLSSNLGGYSTDALGKGLIEYSKEHFSFETYYLMEGQVILREDLQVNIPPGDINGLLGRESEENVYGLNPPKDKEWAISSSKSIMVGGDTVPIVDIYEIDFTKEASEDPTIEGMSLCIVLQPNVTDKNGDKHTIDDQTLLKIGDEAGRKLIEFLRKKPEIGNKIPIYLTLFKADSSDDSLPGTFIGDGYGKENITLKEINEKWAVFPSDTANDLDAVTSQQFNALKQDAFLIIPNDIGIVGKGKFVDNKLATLQITVTTQAKTYTETSALVQKINESLGNFDNDDFEISVRFINNGETHTMIKRMVGTKNTEVISY